MNWKQRMLLVVTLWLLAFVFHTWICDWGHGGQAVVVNILSVGIVVGTPVVSVLTGFLLGIVTPLCLFSAGGFVLFGRGGGLQRITVK
jgi:hypothetical protein